MLGTKHACHMVIDSSRADREYIGEVNNFELINPVLSRLIQSSRSFEIRGDNEELFFLAARFFSFSFKPPPKKHCLSSRPKAIAFLNPHIQPISIGVDNAHT